MSPQTSLRVTAKRPVPKHAIIQWSVVDGVGIAAIIEGAQGTKVRVKGLSSGTALLRVQVRYDDQNLEATSKIFVTVPSKIAKVKQAFKRFKEAKCGYEKVLRYQLLNHLGAPLNHAGIMMSETLEFKNLVSETAQDVTLKMQDGQLKTLPKSSFKTGKQATNQLGRFNDHLRLISTKSLPSNTQFTIEQTLFADGVVVRRNTLNYAADTVRIKEHKGICNADLELDATDHKMVPVNTLPAS